LQEEVEKKTCQLVVRIAVNVGEKSGQFMKQNIKKITDAVNEKLAEKELPQQGEQTVKQLLAAGQGVSRLEVGDKSIRDFKKIANKYGVDFAIVKDKTTDPPVYNCFFKGKDADAITSVLKEYSALVLKKEQKKERPSVLSKLKHFKEIVAKTPRKDKEKRKEQAR
jgi:hypothetical protein